MKTDRANLAHGRLPSMWFALRNHPMALLMPQSGRRPQHQKQTFAAQKVMYALPPKADMCGAIRDVRFVPTADTRKLCSSRPWPSAQELVSAEVFGCFITYVCFFEHTPSTLAIRPMLLKRHRVPFAAFSGEKIAAVD